MPVGPVLARVGMPALVGGGLVVVVVTGGFVVVVVVVVVDDFAACIQRGVGRALPEAVSDGGDARSVGPHAAPRVTSANAQISTPARRPRIPCSDPPAAGMIGRRVDFLEPRRPALAARPHRRNRFH